MTPSQQDAHGAGGQSRPRPADVLAEGLMVRICADPEKYTQFVLYCQKDHNNRDINFLTNDLTVLT